MGRAVQLVSFLLVVWSTSTDAFSSFTQAALTIDSDTGSGSYFGTSISVSGNVVAVGWPQANMFNLVYEYYHDSGEPSTSGNGYVTLYSCATATCTYATRFSPSWDKNSNAMFGASVSLGASGTFLIVGAPRSEYDGDLSDEPWTGAIGMYSCPSPTTCSEISMKDDEGYEYGYNYKNEKCIRSAFEMRLRCKVVTRRAM